MLNNIFDSYNSMFELQRGITSALERMNSFNSNFDKIQRMFAPLSSPILDNRWINRNNIFNNTDNISLARQISTQQINQYNRLIPPNAFETLERITVFKDSFHLDFINNFCKVNEVSIPYSVFKSMDFSVYKALSGLAKEERYNEIKVIENIFEEISSIPTDDIQNDIYAIREYLKKVYNLIKEKIYNLPNTKATRLIIYYLTNFLFVIDAYINNEMIEEDEILENSLTIKGYKEGFKKYETQIVDEYKRVSIETKRYNAVSISNSKIYRTASSRSKCVGRMVSGESVYIIEIKKKWMQVSFNRGGNSFTGWVLKNDFEL